MTVLNDELFEPDAAADADLILRARSGNNAAFGELWRRHYLSGMSVARSITSSIDPDDLVQEAYTRIYQAIIKGGGPNGSFRAYLFTSIRNTAASWGRARVESTVDELETVPDPDTTDQATNEALDRSLTAQAFRSLPTRWQEVLWYTEIEQMKAADVAPLLAMKAGAVSQLAFRAREGLREAWIRAHLLSAGTSSECHWTIEHLGAYSRGNLSMRDQKRADLHLEDCARCMIVAAEAKDVSSRLALVLLPLVLGVGGAAGYTAMLQGAAAPVVALAAMPSSVTGAVTVGSTASSAGAGAFTGKAGASGGVTAGGAGGAGGAGASGGALTGIGALVGTGSAALVVAGVVAAAAIVPGLVNATPVTSMSVADAADGSSITTEVTPDGALDGEDKFVLEIAEDAPKRGDDSETEPSPEVPAPVVPVAPAIRPPVDDGRTGGGGTGPSEPEAPSAPEPDPTPSPSPEPTETPEPEPTTPEEPVEGGPDKPTAPPAEPEVPAGPEIPIEVPTAPINPTEPPAEPKPSPAPPVAPSPEPVPTPEPTIPAPSPAPPPAPTEPDQPAITPVDPEPPVEPTEPPVTEPPAAEPEPEPEPEVTDPEVTDPEVTEPEVTEPEVTEPEVTEPEVTEPEVTEPEVTDPEVTDPEVTDPEVTDPEVTEPEVTDPEVTEPEVTEPEVTEPEVTDPEPSAPTEAVTISSSSVTMDDSGTTFVWITVTGAPGAKVQALIVGSTDYAGSVTLDENGSGIIDLRPSGLLIGLSLITDVDVTFHYTDYPDVPSASTTLLALMAG